MKLQKIFFLSLILFIGINAQNKFNFEFDYSRYNYDSTTVYLELYYSFNQAGLTVVNKENSKVVEAELSIEITDKKDNTSILQKKWNIINPINESSKKGRNLLGVIPFYIREGNYSLHIEGKDKNKTSNLKNYDEEMQIKAFPLNYPAISDIELSTKIIKADKGNRSIFYKNTYEVFPNPTMLYNDFSPVLFYYAEIYNLDKSGKKTLTLHKFLYDSKGTKVFAKTKKIVPSKNARVEVGIINLKKYITDSYNLILALVDSTNNKTYTSNKKFFLYNPSVEVTKVNIAQSWNFLSSEFASMGLEECDDIFKKSKYVATKPEIEQYDEIDSLNAKRKFLYEFWQKRDTEPETPANEFKKEYFDRLNYANLKYKSFSKKGYQSDRGRVYILYGKPDQIDRHPNQMDAKPYEIWYYNSLEGGVSFVFGDLSGFGDYDLLHSTKRGEHYDSTWKRRITE